MDQNIIHLLNLTRRAYIKVRPRHYNSAFGFSYKNAAHRGQEASDIIKKALLESKPLMIGRLGTGELHCVLHSLLISAPKPFTHKLYRYITGKTVPFWWDNRIRFTMEYLGGFFPTTDAALEQYCDLMLKDMPYVDILGSWLKEEEFLAGQLNNVIKVGLQDLEPYYHNAPWSEALQNKKILVIHPFAESIRNQYVKKDRLFKNQRTLPDFELKTLKSAITTPGNRGGFASWFEVLQNMFEKIDGIDFDVAIIGCSTYGFPIAAHIKRLGKKSVHLGGATQVLFGIKGKRWETDPDIAPLFNEYWTRPLPLEHPMNYKSIEGGGYW